MKDKTKFIFVAWSFLLFATACFNPVIVGGGNGQGLLFLIFGAFIMILAMPIWSIIKHPNRLIIGSDGIHYYCRRFTLSSSSSLWIDDYMFYSWDKIQGFYFEWMMSRGVMAHRYLVLEHEQDKAAFIRLNDLTGKNMNI